MDFARKQLEKYGWSDGKGLGKNENGISEALKPKLKRSTTGVGHSAASDHTEHWWSALYDKAANNIEVKEKDGTTKKIKTKDDTGFEITNCTWKLKRKKSKPSVVKPQERYEEFFIKTAVLGSGGSKTERVRESESEDDHDQAPKDVFKITDEELFAACEGRTAHKGARHGLKALGKLARIEEQEKLLLQQSRFNGYSHAKRLAQNKEFEQEIIDVAMLNTDDVPVKKKNKKKHCKKQERYKCHEQEMENTISNSTSAEQNKNSTNLDCTDTLYAGNIVHEGDSLPEKRKKKKKSEQNGGKAKKAIDLECDVSSSRKKNKKRKCIESIESTNGHMDNDNVCNVKTRTKIKKAV